MGRHSKELRVCLVASAGGHLSQLLRLADSWAGYDTFFATTTQVAIQSLERYGRAYVVGECNRQHVLRVLRVFLRCIQIVLKERPNVVISTGAAAGCMVCFISKVCGAQVIWIDSLTNVKSLSLSGRMVRHIADLFLVQWPQLAQCYRNVEFCGALI